MSKGHHHHRKARVVPIKLHDNLPEVLFGYLGAVLWLLAALAFPAQAQLTTWPIFNAVKDWQLLQWVDSWSFNPHLLFWIFSVSLICFGLVFRWNLSKGKFLIVFGLCGTFFGIPAALEIAGIFHPYAWLGGKLGQLGPEMNAGGYFFLGLLCWLVWFLSTIWSRTHLRAVLDESGLSITRADGTTQRYELIGLKTETSNFDYGEYAIGGIGSLVLSLRSGKKIFELKRVVNLYWTPLFFWRKSKIDRINEILSYQGKTTTVEVQDRLDAEASETDASDGYDDDDGTGDHDEHDSEFDSHEEILGRNEPEVS